MSLLGIYLSIGAGVGALCLLIVWWDERNGGKERAKLPPDDRDFLAALLYDRSLTTFFLAFCLLAWPLAFFKPPSDSDN